MPTILPYPSNELETREVTTTTGMRRSEKVVKRYEKSILGILGTT